MHRRRRMRVARVMVVVMAVVACGRSCECYNITYPVARTLSHLSCEEFLWRSACRPAFQGAGRPPF